MKRMYCLLPAIMVLLCCSGMLQLVLAQGSLVSPFDGSVSYTQSVLPEVTLTYSGSGVPKLMTSENRDIQTNWIGAGWFFGAEAIEADLKGTTNIDDDEFSYLTTGGGKTQIVKDNNGVLRLQSNPYWKIELNKERRTDVDLTDSLGIVMLLVSLPVTRVNELSPQADHPRPVGREQACAHMSTLCAYPAARVATG